MASLSIELFKAHVRSDDFSADDAYLAHLLEVAEAWACKAVNRTSEEMNEIGGGSYPPDFVHAIMLIGGHLYDRREPVATGQPVEVPYTLQALIKPYRKLVDDDSRTSEIQD